MTRFLLALIVVLGALSLSATLRRVSSAPIEVCGKTVECLDEPVATDARPSFRPPTLNADSSCTNVGYLCAELASTDSLRLLRWPDGTGSLVVSIPPPDMSGGDGGRSIQRAAARGILAWSGTPFQIRIIEGEAREGEHVDIRIRWTRALPDTRLGQARYSLRLSAGEPVFMVDDFALATRHPLQTERRLTEREIELTAAHEMGHALGLPHSDAKRDVMYPENTALHLTARDYRTMEAVYQIPTGALIVQ